MDIAHGTVGTKVHVPPGLVDFGRETEHLSREHDWELARNAQARKAAGVFYTPGVIVDGLVSLTLEEVALLQAGLPTVLDPCCGTGNFLDAVYRRLLASIPDATQVGPRIGLLTASIFGCDSDARAVEIAKRRLWQTAIETSNEWVPFAEFPHQNFLVGDALSLVPTDDARHLVLGAAWGPWLTAAFRRRFGIVIGNPPYGKVRLPGAQRRYFADSVYGHANTYALFLHLGVELLEDGGALGYVLPASMLSGLYFKNLRKFLIEHCSIRAIVQFGQRTGLFEAVLQEIMFLVVRREIAQGRYQLRVGAIERKEEMADARLFGQALRRVSSDQVLRRPDGYPLIHVPPRDGAAGIYEKYEVVGLPLMHPSIGYVAKTGPIVWNRLKGHLCDQPIPDSLPLVWSNNVSGFAFDATGNRGGKCGYLRLDERTRHLLTRGPCVLVQRTTAKEQRRRLVAAFPLEWEARVGPFFVENHLNAIVPIKGARSVLPECIMALLNSRLLDFVFRASNGNTQVSATELNMMRFVAGSASDQIAAAARDIQSALLAGQPQRAARSVDELDHLVYDLYGLSTGEIRIVESCTQGLRL